MLSCNIKKGYVGGAEESGSMKSGSDGGDV